METVATLLRDHVGLRITSVDRIGIGGYTPRLQHEGGLVQFLLHRAELVRPGRHLPSPALLGHNHDRMLADFDRFVAARQVPVVRFRRGEGEEQLARPYQLTAAAQGRTGVVLVGKAQERMQAWRGWKDAASPRSSPDHPHFSFARQAAVPDHWYF